MKRLLCILSNMNAGGAETFLMKLYRSLDRASYQMDFCVNVRDKNYYEDEINSLGGKMFRIPSRNESFREHNKELYRIIKEEQYKYVLAVSSNSTCFVDLKIAKKAGAEKCCVRSSNSNIPESFLGKLLFYYFRAFYKKYVDIMISPSDLAAKSLFGENSAKSGQVAFLHNAIDYDLFKYNSENRESIRKKYAINNDVKVIGHVGRFNTQKNHSFLIDIFNEYYKVNPNSALMLIGNGNLLEDIKKRVCDLGLSANVFFVGVTRDVPFFLSAMDVFVLPSLYEGMPNVIIEAQANGLPCVISDTITREANITGLVQYVSLNNDARIWADVVNQKTMIAREDKKQFFCDAGYEIGAVSKQFVKLVFNENH